MKLKITLEVDDKKEAYDCVADLSFEHKVLAADLDGEVEKFEKGRKPAHFMKQNVGKQFKGRERDDIKKVK